MKNWPSRLTPALALGAIVLVGACSPPPDVDADSAASPVTATPTQPVPDDSSGVASAGAGNSSSGALAPTLDGVDVAVVGDSLTVSARDQIIDAFSSSGAEVVGFDALDGRQMVDGQPGRPGGLAALKVLEGDSSIDPDVWVIALGTNDVAAQHEPDRLSIDLQALLDTVEAPVVWIDVFVGAYTTESAEFGQLLRAAADDRHGVVVGDWFHEALDLELLTEDHVHLTDEGKAHFAALMVDSVRRSDLG